MAASRAERAGEVLAVLWYLLWIVGLVRAAVDVGIWPFRVLLAGAVVYVGYRFLRFMRRIHAGRDRSPHAV